MQDCSIERFHNLEMFSMPGCIQDIRKSSLKIWQIDWGALSSRRTRWLNAWKWWMPKILLRHTERWGYFYKLQIHSSWSANWSTYLNQMNGNNLLHNLAATETAVRKICTFSGGSCGFLDLSPRSTHWNDETRTIRKDSLDVRSGFRGNLICYF